MTYSAAAVANAFIGLAHNQGFLLSNLKLQKLVYFAHGWYLALVGKPLVSDQIQSWRYGPVSQSLYDQLRHYGSGAVTRLIDTDDRIVPGTDDYRFIETIYEKYGKFSPLQLVALTHEPGSPWEQFGAGEDSYRIIPDEAIRQHFCRQAEAQGIPCP